MCLTHKIPIADSRNHKNSSLHSEMVFIVTHLSSMSSDNARYLQEYSIDEVGSFSILDWFFTFWCTSYPPHSCLRKYIPNTRTNSETVALLSSLNVPRYHSLSRRTWSSFTNRLKPFFARISVTASCLVDSVCTFYRLICFTQCLSIPIRIFLM